MSAKFCAGLGVSLVPRLAHLPADATVSVLRIEGATAVVAPLPSAETEPGPHSPGRDATGSHTSPDDPASGTTPHTDNS